MAAEMVATERPKKSAAETTVRGGLQGITGNWGDEAAAAIDTGISKVPGLRSLAQGFHASALPPVDNPDIPMSQRVDAYRLQNAQAHQDNPKLYNGAQLGGGIAQAALPGVGTAMRAAGPVGGGAFSGALSGAGASEAGTPGGVLWDTAKGAGAGAVTGKIAGSLGEQAEGAVARNADSVRREIAGPGLGGGSRAKELKEQVYEQRQVGDKLMAGDPKLAEAIKAKDLNGFAQRAQQMTDELHAKSDQLYQDVAGKSRFGGVTKDEILQPLYKLADRAQSAGKTGEAKVIQDKIADIESSGMFKPLPGGKTPVADPRALREFISAKENNPSANLIQNQSTNADRALPSGLKMVTGTVRDSLHKWIEETGGAPALKQIEEANARQSALINLKEAATLRAQNMATGVEAGPTGMKAAAMGALNDWKAGIDGRVARPVGAGVNMVAAAGASGLPAPVADALAKKDRQTAVRAIADDIWGGK